MEKELKQNKKETLEEAAKKYANKKGDIPTTKLEDAIFKQGFIDGTKWQQERMYSEEDMLNFAWFLKENLGQFSCDRTAHFEGKYIEQFKKK